MCVNVCVCVCVFVSDRHSPLLWSQCYCAICVYYGQFNPLRFLFSFFSVRLTSAFILLFFCWLCFSFDLHCYKQNMPNKQFQFSIVCVLALIFYSANEFLLFCFVLFVRRTSQILICCRLQFKSAAFYSVFFFLSVFRWRFSLLNCVILRCMHKERFKCYLFCSCRLSDDADDDKVYLIPH